MIKKNAHRFYVQQNPKSLCRQHCIWKDWLISECSTRYILFFEPLLFNLFVWWYAAKYCGELSNFKLCEWHHALHDQHKFQQSMFWSWKRSTDISENFRKQKLKRMLIKLNLLLYARILTIDRNSNIFSCNISRPLSGSKSYDSEKS